MIEINVSDVGVSSFKEERERGMSEKGCRLEESSGAIRL